MTMFRIELKCEDGWRSFGDMKCNDPTMPIKTVYNEANRVIDAIRESWEGALAPPLENFRIVRITEDELQDSETAISWD